MQDLHCGLKIGSPILFGICPPVQTFGFVLRIALFPDEFIEIKINFNN